MIENSPAQLRYQYIFESSYIEVKEIIDIFNISSDISQAALMRSLHS